MAERTVTALVLRRQDRGEADRRLTILTPEMGKIDATAKGARKPASRLAAVSDPLCQATFGIAEGKANRYITQAQPMRSLRGLREDYARLLPALSFVELIAAVMPWEEPSESNYGIALAGLTAISMHENPLIAMVWAQLRLMSQTGFLPSFEFCVNTGLRVQESYGYVVPALGGYVVEHLARAAGDRYQVRAEALVGLARTAELVVPPPRLKFAEECLYALLPIWENITNIGLPATENYASFIRSESVETP